MPALPVLIIRGLLNAYEALAWDASFQGKNDPSGRAVAGVHEEAYKD